MEALVPDFINQNRNFDFVLFEYLFQIYECVIEKFRVIEDKVYGFAELFWISDLPDLLDVYLDPCISWNMLSAFGSFNQVVVIVEEWLFILFETLEHFLFERIHTLQCLPGLFGDQIGQLRIVYFGTHTLILIQQLVQGHCCVELMSFWKAHRTGQWLIPAQRV